MVDWELFFQVLIWSVFILVVCMVTFVLIRRSLDKRIGVDKSRMVARITVPIIALLLLNGMLVNLFGVSLTLVLTSLGIVGVAVAFASQQVMQNAIAGWLIALDKRIKTNDWVEVGGTPNTTLALVKDIRTLGTLFVDVEGREFIVPNSFILENKVINYSQAGMVMVHLSFTLSLRNDLDRFRKMVIEEAELDGRILPWSEKKSEEKRMKVDVIRKYLEYQEQDTIGLDPFKPSVQVSEINDKGMSLQVRLWSNDIPQRYKITSEMYERLVARLQKEGYDLYAS